jgi:hypothetical protein
MHHRATPSGSRAQRKPQIDPWMPPDVLTHVLEGTVSHGDHACLTVLWFPRTPMLRTVACTHDCPEVSMSSYWQCGPLGLGWAGEGPWGGQGRAPGAGGVVPWGGRGGPLGWAGEGPCSGQGRDPVAGRGGPLGWTGRARGVGGEGPWGGRSGPVGWVGGGQGVVGTRRGGPLGWAEEGPWGGRGGPVGWAGEGPWGG